MCVSVPASPVVSLLVLCVSVCLCSEHRTVLSLSFILGFFFFFFFGALLIHVLDDFFLVISTCFFLLQRAKKKKVQVHSYSWKPAGRESVLAVVCLFSVFCFFFFSSWKPRCNFYCQLHGCMLCRAMFIQQIGSAWISGAGTATLRHRILNFIAAALKQTKNKPQHATVFFLFVAS